MTRLVHEKWMLHKCYYLSLASVFCRTENLILFSLASISLLAIGVLLNESCVFVASSGSEKMDWSIFSSCLYTYINISHVIVDIEQSLLIFGANIFCNKIFSKIMFSGGEQRSANIVFEVVVFLFFLIPRNSFRFISFYLNIANKIYSEKRVNIFGWATELASAILFISI